MRSLSSTSTVCRDGTAYSTPRIKSPLWRRQFIPFAESRRPGAHFRRGKPAARNWSTYSLPHSSRSPPITRCSVCRPDTLRISLRCQVWQSRHVGTNNLCIAVCPCSPARPPLLRSRCASSNLLYHPSLSTVTAAFRLPRFQRTPILPLQKTGPYEQPYNQSHLAFPAQERCLRPFQIFQGFPPLFSSAPKTDRTLRNRPAPPF